MICILGPTATGKTDLVLELAEHFHLALISVDSALVYRGMDIGTAKPSPEQLARYPHYLINISDPSEPFSAADFCEASQSLLSPIQDQGKIPCFVGGTMLYYRSLWQGLSPLPPANSEIRKRLLEESILRGWEGLHRRLKTIDPISAARIHPNDPQRIQRALEVYELTGQPLSTIHQLSSSVTLPQMLKIGLAPSDRGLLHQRIETRFDAMLKAGFIDEVASLKARQDLSPDLPALKAVGYRQVWSYLAGEYSYETMREKGIIATRQLAKHQLTWMRRFEDLLWFDPSSPQSFQQIVDTITEFLG